MAIIDRVLVVHEDGKISLVSSELKVLATSPPRSTGTVLESWLFPASTCTFISSAVGEAVALVLTKKEDVARVSLAAVSAEDSLGVLGDVELAGVVASVSAPVALCRWLDPDLRAIEYSQRVVFSSRFLKRFA